MGLQNIFFECNLWYIHIKIGNFSKNFKNMCNSVEAVILYYNNYYLLLSYF